MRLVLWIICTGCCGSVLAQQKPRYTQYILNQYIINPALTGIENYVDIKVSHRHQWVGLNGSPVTTYFTIHGALNKKDYRSSATSYRVPGENPRGRSYWENYTAAAPHHGIGLQVMDDRSGPLNQFSAYATYAYHIGIGPRTSLAAGFGVGITDLRLDKSKLDFGEDIRPDPAVYPSGSLTTIRPDFNAGLYLYSADYFVGLSALQIIPEKISFQDNIVRKEDGKLVPHIFATAGYRFLLDEDFNLLPSVMIKYVDPLPVQVDVNLKLQYQDLAWVGATFRPGDGFAAMLGINLSNTFNIGYAYDYATTALNTVSQGTHEILLGFILGNRYGDGCPRNVW